MGVGRATHLALPPRSHDGRDAEYAQDRQQGSGHAGQGRAADDGEPAVSGDVGGKKVRKDTRTGYLAIDPSSGGPKVYRLSRRGNRRPTQLSGRFRFGEPTVFLAVQH